MLDEDFKNFPVVMINYLKKRYKQTNELNPKPREEIQQERTKSAKVEKKEQY